MSGPNLTVNKDGIKDKRVNSTYCRFSCDVVIFHNKKISFPFEVSVSSFKRPFINLTCQNVLAQQDSSFCDCRAHLNFLSCIPDESLFGSLKVVFTYGVVIVRLLRLFWIGPAFPTTLQFLWRLQELLCSHNRLSYPGLASI